MKRLVRKLHSRNKVHATYIRDVSPSGLRYDALPEGLSIRVLDLAPGTWDQTVECSLRTVRLNDHRLQYEAISYAWGDPTDRKSISCNGHVVSVTRSLFEALQRFRNTKATRTLWADAICINQSATEERTSQVRLMSIIFQKAVCVLVWLQHEEPDRVQASLNALCRYLRIHTPDRQVSYRWRGRIVTSFKEYEHSFESASVAMDALHLICLSPWFARGWVIQEVVLSSSACVFWGHAQIDFDLIGAAAFAANKMRHSSGSDPIPIRQCLFIYLMYDSRHRSDRVVSFFTLLLTTIGFTFSEPKDRVYGLLGLRTLECDPADGHPFIDPDYAIPAMDCFRKVTEKLLFEWRDLRVLSWVQHGQHLNEDWPSWVPNWNKKVAGIFANVQQDPAEAPGTTLIPVLSKETHGARQCIGISGFRVDTVTRGIIEYHESPKYARALLRSLEIIYGPRYLAGTFGNAEKGRSLAPSRMATLLDDYRAFMDRKPALDPDAIDGPSTVVTYEHAAELGATRFYERYQRDRAGHVLFQTNEDMIGLGSEGMRSSDVVVVLHGASVPFVLRPVDSLWRLIGECYLYDFVEGRIIREWEARGSVSEKFCIY